MFDIVIPTYNRDTLTIRAVESVLRQSYQKFNLYIIEDGSNSFEVFYYNFLYKDSRIKYFSLDKNYGVAYARNYGVSLGNNSYIAFLDSDDEWDVNKLEKQLNFLEQNTSLLWLHTNEKWIRDGCEIHQKNKYKKQGGLFIERLFKFCLISVSSVVFKRSFWEDYVIGFNPFFRLAEDYELWLRLNFDYPIGFIEEPLTIKHTGNWLQLSSSSEIDRQRVLALHRFYKLASNKPLFPKIYPFWYKEILYKIHILQKGSLKYGRLNRYQQYQNWERLFTADFTRFQSIE